MRWLLMCAVVLCWLTWSPDGVGYGQIVRKDASGVVRVRAPFVTVDVGPDGRTSVRAPFTAVDVPGHRHIANRPHSKTRVFDRASVARGRQPTLADPALADWAALWRMLDSATIRLNEQLGQISTGSGWKEYLQTVRLRETLAAQGSGPPDSQTVAQLRDILARYDAISHDPSYRVIAGMPAFQTTHKRLGDYVHLLSATQPEGDWSGRRTFPPPPAQGD